MVLLKALMVDLSLQELNSRINYSGQAFVSSTEDGPCHSVISIVPLVCFIMTGVDSTVLLCRCVYRLFHYEAIC
jgi:hypothetical protein